VEQVAAAAETDKMAITVDKEELHLAMVEVAATQEFMAEAEGAQVAIVVEEEEEVAFLQAAEAAMAEAAAQAAVQRQAARARRLMRIICLLPGH